MQASRLRSSRHASRGFHLDRVTCGHCHHCHTGGNAVTGAQPGPRKRPCAYSVPATSIKSESPCPIMRRTTAITTNCHPIAISIIVLPPGLGICPHDVAMQMLLSVNNSKKVFYDPGTSSRFGDMENFGDPTFDSSGYAKNLWDYGITGADASANIDILGYIFSFGGGKNCLLQPCATNSTTQAERTPDPRSSLFPPVFYPRFGSGIICLCDTSAVRRTLPARRFRHGTNAANSYTDVKGGFYLHHLSPHLKGLYPRGGNIGFKDGHVEWRKFDDMRR